MSLLDRVATLIRANLNDLVDKSEDPEKLLKQLLLDMQNQFLQLKTQTAIAIADQHLLDGKRTENINAQDEWRRKAELALAHNDEASARAALERSLTHQGAAEKFAAQREDQSIQVTRLRDALTRLEAKMTEARTRNEILVARHRRARVALQTGRTDLTEFGDGDAFERLRTKVSEAEALGEGYAATNELSPAAKLDGYERNDKVESLLAELKRKRAGNA